MKSEIIRRIIRKRNYGFLRLIDTYTRDIASACMTKEEITDAITAYTGGQKESLSDVYQSLNKRLNRFIVKASATLKNAMVHGAKKLVDQKGNTFEFRIPKYTAQLSSLVQNNLKLVQKIHSTQQLAIIQSLSDGISQGKTYNQVASDIVAKVDGIGKMKAQLIAVTEISKAHAMAQRTLMRENGIAKYQWLTARDKNVCDKCAGLDMQVFTVSESSPLPVRDTHPRCRCVTVAYMK